MPSIEDDLHNFDAGNLEKLKLVLVGKKQFFKELQIARQFIPTVATTTTISESKRNLLCLHHDFNNSLTAWCVLLKNTAEFLEALPNSSIAIKKITDILQKLDQLNDNDSKEILDIITDFNATFRTIIVDLELPDLKKLSDWFVHTLTSAAMNKSNFESIYKSIQAEEFKPHHLRLFFNILHLKNKQFGRHDWREFYAIFSQLYHEKFVITNETRALNKEKLNVFNKFIEATNSSLLASNSLETIASDVENIAKKIRRTNKEIVGAEKQEQLANLNTEILILESLIAITEQSRLLVQKVIDLNKKISNPGLSLETLPQIKLLLNKLQSSLHLIDDELSKLSKFKQVENGNYTSNYLQLSVLSITLQKQLTTANEDIKSKEKLLVNDKLQTIKNSILQANNNLNSFVLTVKNTHDKSRNSDYRLIVKNVTNSVKKIYVLEQQIKDNLQHNDLQDSSLAIDFKQITKDIDSLTNNIVVKKSCLTAALIRITERERIFNDFKQELKYMLVQLKTGFFKRNFSVNPTSITEKLINNLNKCLEQFIIDGNSAVFEFVIQCYKEDSDYELHPILNRLILAIKGYDETIPVGYATDYSSEMYRPSNSESTIDAQIIHNNLYQHNSTKPLADSLNKLFISLQKMEKYGNLLQDNKLPEAAIVLKLAEKLKRRIYEFLIENETDLSNHGSIHSDVDNLSKNRTTFEQEFRVLLHSEDDKLKNHKDVWKPITGNIAHNLLKVAKLLYKFLTHPSTFFSQKSKCLQKVDAVEQSLDNLLHKPTI